jgi:hypothetical protein
MMENYSRCEHGQGQLIRDSYIYMQSMIQALRDRGDEAHATAIEGHANRCPLDDPIWLAPYLELIEQEEARIASLSPAA